MKEILKLENYQNYHVMSDDMYSASFKDSYDAICYANWMNQYERKKYYVVDVYGEKI